MWRGPARAGSLCLCEATRTEFLYSATGPSHRDELSDLLDELCRSTPVPKTAWRWVESAQYRLTQHGQHRPAGVIDLVVCATAIHHGLTVLHTDDDFVTVSRVITDLRQYDIRK
ncbi:PIN domain-containing protein [Nocardia stercoris]|uniref:PIN domain-containing protein n=1 Tax=Nocardia stercoris TaxID=2483361 RepID=A0A3M2LHH1_9NOCA|nr:PIN domain-containing protein [Nocardia stercoris]RMI34218.1 PIN domain-containing protein [Nocardia stercoris]